MPRPAVHPPPQPGDDLDHLARYRDGDVQAFRDLVDQYQERVRHFFFRLCWDRDQADDLAQDLFVRLLQSSARYRPEGRLSTFVWRVATNMWIDHYRAQRLLHRRAGPLEAVLAGLCGTGSAPLDSVVRDEEQRSVRAALQQLGEHHRLVIELAVNQDLPYAEISELLGIPVGTVKSRMHHAIAALKAIVGADASAAVEARRAMRHG